MSKFQKPAAVFVAISSEKVSAREFLSLKSRRPDDIKTVKFVAPRLGTKGFGAFDVEYRTPKLVGG